MKTALTIMLLLSLTIAAQATPVNQSQIPDDVDWVVHLDLDLLRKSDFGQAVRQQLEMMGLDAHMTNFQNTWGFNPQESVSGITMFGYGRDCEQTVIMLHGVFNEQSINQAIRTKQQYQQSTYRNLNIHSWHADKACGEENGKTANGCMFNNTLIIMSVNIERVQEEIDALTGYKANLDAQGGIADVARLSQGSFLVAGARNLQELASAGELEYIASESHNRLNRAGLFGRSHRGQAGNFNRAAILRQCDEVTLSVRQQNDDLHLQTVLLAEDTETAGNICQVLYGIRAFAMLAHEERPQLAEMARSVEFSCEGEKIDIDLSCPWETVFGFITHRWEQLTQ